MASPLGAFVWLLLTTYITVSFCLPTYSWYLLFFFFLYIHTTIIYLRYTYLLLLIYFVLLGTNRKGDRPNEHAATQSEAATLIARLVLATSPLRFVLPKIAHSSSSHIHLPTYTTYLATCSYQHILAFILAFVDRFRIRSRSRNLQ